MATKIKSLRPSLREKKRYMVFEILSRQPVSESEASDAIWKGCLGHIGELGMAKAGITILHDRWRQDPQQGIIRASHTQTSHIRSALSLVREAGGKQATFSTIGMSGILDKASKNFMDKAPVKNR